MMSALTVGSYINHFCDLEVAELVAIFIDTHLTYWAITGSNNYSISTCESNSAIKWHLHICNES